MSHRLPIDILPQPDDVTCGPTCLQAVYSWHGDELPLEQVIREVPQLPLGGTLAVHLACHALSRGLRARIYTYNLQVFDPTWFGLEPAAFADKLREQRAVKHDDRLEDATEAYLRFLHLGGELRQADLTPGLLRRYLSRQLPILTGLSATWLYGTAREIPETNQYDDVQGFPAGHFVVLSGLDEQRRVHVADPYDRNPMAPGRLYDVPLVRVVSAVLLGSYTRDANLLVVAPQDHPQWPS